VIVNQSRSDYGFLDAARGASAFVVLLAHCVQVFWLRFFGADSMLNVVSSTLSSYAVILFFLLSGFLITHSIEANIRRNGRFDALSYASARAARIYPPFLVAFALTLLVFGVLEKFALPGRGSVLAFPGDLYSAREIVSYSQKEMVASLLMLNGGSEVNGPLWSLYMEVKLYVLLACAYCVCLAKTRIPALIIGVGVLLVAFRFQPEFARYAALWLLGCVAYFALGDRVPARQLKLWGCVVAALGFAVAGTWMMGASQSGFTVWDTALELLIASVLIALLVRFRLQVPVGREIAPYSYTLYVIHFPILLLSQSLLIASGEDGLAAVVIVSAASVVLVLLLAWVLGSVERHKRSIQSALEKSGRSFMSRWRAVPMNR
jgi:peptidoglycan/LPS O-acetylase OafA/YrhL